MTFGQTASDDLGRLRNLLADRLVEIGCITAPDIEDAFRTVPRHVFVPDIDSEQVYSDRSIPVKYIDGKLVSSSSQPAIMAIQLEQLQLRPGHRILEIGAGTGYNAGLMRFIVGDDGSVVTVDIDEDIVTAARTHLASAGFGDVTVVCGDGGYGYTGAAPYDRILLTAGAPDILPAWQEQLKSSGILVVPLEITGGVQASVAFEKKDDHLESVSVRDCGFMMLRGDFAKTETIFTVSTETGIRLGLSQGDSVGRDTVDTILACPNTDLPTGVFSVAGEVIYGGLLLWLSLREPGLCELTEEGSGLPAGTVPRFFVYPGRQRYGTVGLWEDGKLAVFIWPDGGETPCDPLTDSQRAELRVRSYGNGTALAERLAGQVQAWDAAGRPGSDRLRIRACQKTAGTVSGEYEIEKEWTRIGIDLQ